MIHAKTSFSLLDHCNFKYLNDIDNDSQNICQDDDQEEIEDYPLVWYHLPSQKPDPKQEKLKAESLLKRNQQILEKKKQTKDHLVQPFNLIKTCERGHAFLKKINNLPRSRLVHYIPEKNLLLILFEDNKTVNVYNTLNLKLVAVTKAQKEVICMSYSQQLGRIIVGGEDEFLQLWSPRTFQVKAERPNRNNYLRISSVAYVAKSNVIVAKTPDQIRIYNTGLRFMTFISIPPDVSGPNKADIFGLSKNFLLIFCHSWTQKIPILFNLKTANVIDFSKAVFIPITTSLEMTEKTPVNIFACLGMFQSRPAGLIDDKYLYPLIQFTIDTKKEELVPLRSSDASMHAFSQLNRIQNSNYFLAGKLKKAVFKTFLLSIHKDQIEILRVMSGPSPINLHKFSTYFMLKDGLTVVEKDEQNLVHIYRSIIYRGKSKNIVEQNSP